MYISKHCDHVFTLADLLHFSAAQHNKNSLRDQGSGTVGYCRRPELFPCLPRTRAGAVLLRFSKRVCAALCCVAVRVAAFL